MKKTITVLILLSSLYSNAQDKYLDYNEEKIFEQPSLTNVLILLVLAFIVYFVIAKIEGLKRYKDKFYDKQGVLIVWAVGLFVGIIVLLKILNVALLNKLSFIAMIILGIKICVAFFVSTEAKKLERNSTVWWVLGFLEYHVALIVLGLNPKLIKVRKEFESNVEEINAKYLEQNTNLIALKKNNMLSRIEFENKKEQMIASYRSEMDLLTNQEILSNSLEKENSILSKLKQAYEDELLTLEEYNKKIDDLKQ